jgi:SWI/SNF-related matrix-associated actin-dependent regulator 1 of chromatin subfamily A
MRKILLSKYASKKGLTYYPFQERLIRDMLDSKSEILYNGCPMGLGKSAMGYGYAYNKGVTSLLVVCTASIRIKMWRELIWAGPNLQDGLAILSYKDLEYLQKRSMWKKGRDPAVLIVSHDMLVRNERLYKYVFKRNWEMAIIDEADCCSNLGAKRTQNMIKICEEVPNIVFMSGTPLRVSGMDMYPHLSQIVPQTYGVTATTKKDLKRCTDPELFAANYTYMRDNPYATKDPTTHYIYNKVRNPEEFRDMVKRTESYFKISKQEALPDLPEKTYSIVEINLSVKGISETEEFIAEYEAYIKKGKETPHIASLRQTLGIAKSSHPDTIEFIQQLIDNDCPAIVFAHHKSSIDYLMNAFRKYRPVKIDGSVSPTDKQRNVDKFQDGKTPLIIGNLKAMGVGLDLTISSDVVFTEISAVPAVMEQAIDRAHRIGQKNAVRAHYIVSLNKFDRDIVKSLVQRQKSFDRVGLV